MSGTGLVTIALLAARAAATLFYAGVAESGGEFAAGGGNTDPRLTVPGTYGKDYYFINEASVDTYVDDNKINTFRLPFLLERMSPVTTGLGATFDETHFKHYEDAVNYITVTKGAYCIIDPHNYMRYNYPTQPPYDSFIIGDKTNPAAATTEQFGAFWGELARRFKDNEKVIFELMNEPNTMDTNVIFANNQAAITAIRASGADQLILAPGNAWTGAAHWTEDWQGNSPSSGSLMYKLVDPKNNTAMDIHQYFENGTKNCTIATPTAFKALTAWLNQYQLKAMVTEFGAANGTQCGGYLNEFLDYMEDNSVYIGWTAWAAGPWWGSYSPCCTSGGQYGSLEPGSKAADGGPSLYDTVWLAEMQPRLPKTLQRTGMSSISGYGNWTKV